MTEPRNLLLNSIQPIFGPPESLPSASGYKDIVAKTGVDSVPTRANFEVLAYLLDRLPDGVALIDKDGTVLLTNQAWSQDEEHAAARPGDIFHGVGTDELTGAATRRRFYDQAERTLARAHTEGLPFSLLYLDLDNFKSVNDRYGHTTGDLLLKNLSARLQSLLRTGDVLARFGGDEFVLLLKGVSGAEVGRVQERYERLLEVPFVIEGHELRVVASFGEASFPEQGRTIDELLQHADTTMYRNKAAHQQGR